MPPRLSSNDSDKSFEADDYEWAEFNLPPALRSAGANEADISHISHISQLWSVDPGLG